jgi:hypothetical protein
MPAGRQSFMVQMRLTGYKPEQTVLIDRLSAVPDGSSVVYSADEVNGKGNYEIYRVAREGGAPVAISNTTRDEFSPAMSPNGRSIALASNQLGNLDLFTMPVSGGESKHIRLNRLKFYGPSGSIHVRSLDEFGEPTPVRLYVEAFDGKAYCPPGHPIYYYPLDPGGHSQGFFLSSGDATFPVPAGRVRLTAMKGIEYRIAERTANVGTEETAEITITMERWTNWAQRGWYTGENHFHGNYNGGYYLNPRQELVWLQAEDLNGANMVVANYLGDVVHDREFFTGAVNPVSTERYVLYWGQEYRNNDPLGHMGFLSIKQLVKPFYTSFFGSKSPYDFPLNTMAAQEARKQGGLITYMHPMAGSINDVFDTGAGAKEGVVAAAFGALDAMDLLPFGEAAYQIWYRLLNCGFRLSPGGGTDAFSNWRGINRIPGSSRQYVHIGGNMNWDRWIARYKEGRAFVTNGPLLEFAVNGQPMGSEVRIPSDQSYRAKLTAEVTTNVPLSRVEFIQNGNVVESREVVSSERSLRLEKDVDVNRSCWFAVRVTGRPARGVSTEDRKPRAHSGPVYLVADGRPTLVEEDLQIAIRWLDSLWANLVDRDNFGSSENRARAQAMIDQARSHYVKKLEQAKR